MRFQFPIGVLGALITTLLTGMPVIAGVQVAGLSPHRAFYSVSLGSSQDDAMVSDVSGVMTMSLERTCDAWIFTQDFRTAFELPEGGVAQQVALFTSWESLDGRQYRFASRRTSGGERSIVRGYAEVDSSGKGNAHYREPEVRDVQLPEGTLFPVGHTAWLIDQAVAGKRNASRIVFQGSEEFQPERVNAFIGNEVPAGDRDVAVSSPLDERPGWPLVLAFHPMESTTGVPLVEMEIMQLDNGVAPRLVLDYGDYSIDIRIERLESLDVPACP